MNTDNPCRLLFFIIRGLGLITICLSGVFSPGVLSRFSGDGKLEPSTIANITDVRFYMLAFGILLSATGVFGVKFIRLARYCEHHPTLFNAFFSTVLTAYLIAILELALRANPLLTTMDTLKGSPSYLPSSMSQHRLDPADQNVLNMDTRRSETRFSLHNGYRADAFSPVKRAGEIRLFIMGGSHVFDPNSPLHDDWPTRIEQELHSQGLTQVRVINAGIPGHRTFDLIGRLCGEIHLFSPDYVVLCCTYNDLKYFRWISPYDTPLQRIDPLTRPSHTDPGSARRLIEHSQLFLRLDSIWAALCHRRPKAGPDLDKMDESAETDAVTDYALAQYTLNVQTFVDVCINAGIRPILFTESRLITPKNCQTLDRRLFASSTRLSPQALADVYMRCDAILHEVATAKRAHFFDMAAQCSGRREHFRDVIHFNAAGSPVAAKVAAEYLAQVIREDGN